MFYAYANRLGAYKPGLDPDAAAYIAAVETTDGQALESGVRKAINNFVVGCKGDGIWDAIKASCILAGARTLDGALVPLVGTAPTNNNFVPGDYNRETGLIGDASTKYLNSNRNNNADPQDSNHNAAFVSEKGNTDAAIMGSPFVSSGINNIVHGASGQFFTRNRTTTGTIVFSTFQNGFVGISRNVSTSYNARNGGSNATVNEVSITPTNSDIFVYRRSITPSILPSNARISFYSIGESLDLAALDTRVSNLMTEIATAIP